LNAPLEQKNLFLSVVIPVYNSQDGLEELTSQLSKVLDELKNPYQIVLVNDFSPDQSWDIIKQVSLKNKNILGISLRKNFGQDSAIMAGLAHATGKYIIIMDDDLQHDPVYIPDLLKEIEKGCDVVYANYEVKKQTLWKNFGSWLNGKFATLVIRKPPGVYLSPFKIIRFEVAQEILKYQGAYPYVEGLLFRVTSRFSQIPIEHRERYKGKSNFTFLKSLWIWSNLVTNFSVLPLRLATLLGFATAFLGFFLSITFFFYKLIFPETPVGWTSTILVILTLGGIQLFSAGVMGEYIGRTFLNINREPQYVVAELTQPHEKV